jgi:hypothetical protein
MNGTMLRVWSRIPAIALPIAALAIYFGGLFSIAAVAGRRVDVVWQRLGVSALPQPFLDLRIVKQTSTQLSRVKSAKCRIARVSQVGQRRTVSFFSGVLPIWVFRRARQRAMLCTRSISICGVNLTLCSASRGPSVTTPLVKESITLIRHGVARDYPPTLV